MMQKLFLAISLSILSYSTAAFGQATREPQLDMRKMMTAQEFEQSGLSKLTRAELDALNAWVGKFSTHLYRTAQSGGGGGCSTVIETQINGAFEGWSGNTIFKLFNGQIWQQSSYAYTYSYAFMPKVMIYPSGGNCMLKVEGVSDTISVKRIR
jgi:hypothetical protein